MLHTAGELARKAISDAGQIHQREIAPTPFCECLRRHVAQTGDVTQVFVDAQVIKKRKLLREITDIRARDTRQLTQQRDVAGRGIKNSGEHVERRRFARAVRTDKSEDLAMIHVEVDATHRLDVTVVLG